MSPVSWQGVYPAVLTPFKEDDTIDFDQFKINTEAQLDTGVDGIVLAGSLGEASTLLNSEKIDLDMFEQLAGVPNIQAVKESTRDVTNITRMFNRFGDRYRVLTGVDPLALESLCLGADGWVAGLSDAFPQETVAIYRLAKAGNYAEALQIYRWFLPVLELDIYPKLVQYIKLAASLTGLCTEHVRAPRLPLRGEERERVIRIVQRALDSRPLLPDYGHLQKGLIALA